MSVVAREHFAIAVDGYGVVGIELQKTALAHRVVDQLRERMAEAAEALAVLIAGGEPTIFRRMLGPKVDVAVFLLDQQSCSGILRRFWEFRTQERQRIVVEVFHHPESLERTPGVNGVEDGFVVWQEDYARQNLGWFWEQLKLRFRDNAESALAADEKIDPVHVRLQKVAGRVFRRVGKRNRANVEIDLIAAPDILDAAIHQRDTKA